MHGLDSEAPGKVGDGARYAETVVGQGGLSEAPVVLPLGGALKPRLFSDFVKLSI